MKDLKKTVPTLLTLFFAWQVFGQPETAGREPDAGQQIKEMMIPAGGVTLHARIAGNMSAGKVLLAVNGGPGQSSRYMVSLERLANAERCVVTYDQRGTGQSSGPSDGYDLLKYVEDLDAVRQAVGAKSIHILGHSWGGIVAMRYATIHPERVDSLILAGAGPPSWEASREGQAKLGQRIGLLQTEGVIPNPLPDSTERVLEAILPAYFADPRFKIPEELKKTPFNEETYQQTLAAAGNWDFSADVKKLTHRILILWGEQDPFGPGMAEGTKNTLANARVKFVLLKGCGHYWLECPEEFFNQVRGFLE
ncbi:MAG: alpha/beta hydrolase [Candidatus Aminicenantes bacterium]|nr:alpha/beta hydrolase [Candidatus Aminicenantes bacterium]